MKKIVMVMITITITANSCKPQTPAESSDAPLVGGPCEGCEAIFEYGDRKLTNVDTLPDFHMNQPQLKITGTVYQRDGSTPAPDVVVYIYHTNRQGIYPKQGNETGWGRRHGYIRGWIKTDKSGAYTFYTFRPAAYPGRTEPEHIHVTIKEPQKNPYYIDDFLFDDDPLLSDNHRNRLSKRGGNGIVKTQHQQGMLTVHRDLVLGLNIPNYD